MEGGIMKGDVKTGVVLKYSGVFLQGVCVVQFSL